MSWNKDRKGQNSQPPPKETPAAAAPAPAEAKPPVEQAAATAPDPKPIATMENQPAPATPDQKEAAPAATPEAKPKEPPAAAAQSQEPPDDEAMIPQKRVARIIKKVRESVKEQSSSAMNELKAENQRLKEKLGEATPPAEPDPEAEKQRQLAEQAEEQAFLARQDQRGRDEHGQYYVDCLELVTAQQDPVLWKKITKAADPVKKLLEEAVRISEEIELGADPAERQKKRDERLIANARATWEKELSTSIAARNNQPTDVQGVRAAGGDVKPARKRSSWATVLPNR